MAGAQPRLPRPLPQPPTLSRPTLPPARDTGSSLLSPERLWSWLSRDPARELEKRGPGGQRQAGPATALKGLRQGVPLPRISAS